MAKTLSMVSHKNYNLNANEGFVIFLTSKLIPCLSGSFTSKMKSQSIVYLFNGCEHIYVYIYMILDLQDEVHSIWVVWTKWPSKYARAILFWKSGGVDREHGLHPGNEGGVLGVGPNPKHM